MSTKKDLLQELEIQIERGKAIVLDLQEQKESLRQNVLQAEIDDLEKWMAESEVKMSTILSAAEDAWEELSHDIQELIFKLKAAGDRILHK